jgi:hypothetical protein
MLIIAAALSLARYTARKRSPAMFRFTIRELLLLTVVVALSLGWGLRERQLRSELERAQAYRGRAWALEHAAVEEGWRIEWDWHRKGVVHMETPNASRATDLSCVPSDY